MHIFHVFQYYSVRYRLRIFSFMVGKNKTRHSGCKRILNLLPAKIVYKHSSYCTFILFNVSRIRYTYIARDETFKIKLSTDTRTKYLSLARIAVITISHYIAGINVKY
uniref:Uncharacterized protein n=1 Tax=Schizaphis graminum TaxID=13262 RepID=A0A2S2NFX1_SCHGA